MVASILDGCFPGHMNRAPVELAHSVEAVYPKRNLIGQSLKLEQLFRWYYHSLTWSCSFESKGSWKLGQLGKPGRKVFYAQVDCKSSCKVR